MVKDYTNHFYVPEIRQGNLVQENHYERERKLSAWKEHVYQAWKKLELYVDGRREGQLSLGEGFDVHAWVRADDLNPEDLCIELVYGEAEDELAIPRFAFPMEFVKRENDGSYRYDIQLKPSESGSVIYNIRVIPSHPSLTEKYEVGLIRWA
jgi:starch phosphorylase